MAWTETPGIFGLEHPKANTLLALGKKIPAQRLAALIDTPWWSRNQRCFNFFFSLYFIFFFVLSIQNVVAPAQGKQAQTMISVWGWLVQSRWNFLNCAVCFWFKHFPSSADKTGTLLPFQTLHRSWEQPLKRFVVTFLTGKFVWGKDFCALSVVIKNTKPIFSSYLS